MMLIKRYGYKNAVVTKRFSSLPDVFMRPFREYMAALANRRVDNHEVYELGDTAGKLYLGFSDHFCKIGTSIHIYNTKFVTEVNQFISDVGYDSRTNIYDWIESLRDQSKFKIEA